MIYVRYGKPINIKNVEEAVFVRFDFSNEILASVKALSLRYWLANEKKEWEITKEGLTELHKIYNEEIKGIRDEDKSKEVKKREDYWSRAEIPSDYKFKTEPFKYQRDYLEMALTRDKFLTGDSMGLGKSKQSIDLICIRKHLGQINKCLVINGIKGLNTNFLKQIEIHSNEKGKILGTKITRKGTLKEGSNQDKINDLDLIEGSDILFWITNIESFRSEAFSDKVKELCDKKIINAIIYDEATMTSNPRSLQSKGLIKIDCQYKNVMSGTFFRNFNDDLYFPLMWIGEEKRTFEEFKKEYCVEQILQKTFQGRWGGFFTKEFSKVIKNKNERELYHRLNPLMIRRLRDEIENDLPPIIFEKVYVEMDKEQTKLYEEIKDELLKQIEALGQITALLKKKEEAKNKGMSVAEIDDELDKQEKIVKGILEKSGQKLEDISKLNITPEAMTVRLRQVTGNPRIINEMVGENAKLNKVEEMVEENVKRGDKTVIFSTMTTMTNEIKKRLKKYNPAYITGEVTNITERQKEQERFQNDDNCKVIIGTRAMAMGYDLYAGNHVIIYDEEWTPDLLQQQIGRIQRNGQKKKMTSTILLCANTIDERVNAMVEAKRETSNIVLDGGKEVLKKSQVAKMNTLDYLLG